MITASLKNYRIAPRKVRIVADMIRGKDVEMARVILEGAMKKAKHPLLGLLDSAIANAKNNFKMDATLLKVGEIRVDQGYVLRRSIPMSRGSAFPIKKETSHVLLVLVPKTEKKVEDKPKKVVKKSK
jgi:large subunit ribosomal protein L22